MTAPPFICILTPEGRGAIAVVRVWGAGALELADRVFRPAQGRALRDTPPGRIRLGRVGRGMGDEVVAVVLAEPSPCVEFQTHGGPIPVAMVVEALTSAGARLIRGRPCIEQVTRASISAQALSDLAEATTLRTAEILLEQSQGAFERALEGLITAISHDPAAALGELEPLIERARMGTRLLSGWRVVLTGRPNVGKSRLLNALAGYERVIVDPTPGTTRDAVVVLAAFEGWPVALVDTAGVRDADDVLERAGIERALREGLDADLLLKILDRSEPLTQEDRALIERDAPAILVASKADLSSAWRPEDLGIDPASIVTVSAQRGDGLEMLIKMIADRLVPSAPPPGAAIPFRTSQLRSLEETRELVLAGRTEEAKNALGRIVCGADSTSE